MASSDVFIERKRDNLAPCWKYFLWCEETCQVKCKFDKCGKILKSKNSTSMMITHLKSIHKISFEPKSSNAGRKPTPKITSFLKKVEKETPDEVVAKLCAVDGISMYTVANSEMLQKSMKAYGVPLPKSPSTVQKLLMENFEKMKALTIKKIELELSKNVRFSVTLDEYTSNSNMGFVNINLHLGDGSICNLGVVEMNDSTGAEEMVKIVTKR